MKIYLYSDETKVACDEKFDPPSLMDKQIVAITNLTNEIIEMVLVDAVYSSKNSQKHMLYCHRPTRDLMIYFSEIKMHFSKNTRMKFPDSAFDSLRRFHDIMKVSVRKNHESIWSE